MVKQAKKILILLSGGADSATCLAKAVDEVGSDNVVCLNAYYGQKLDKEMACAKELSEYYKTEYITFDISKVMEYSDCSILKSGREVEHKPYSEQLGNNIISSYVPFRNGVFLSIAAAIADSRGIDEVWYGAHDDDYAYPDCSDSFIENMTKAILVGTSNGVKMKAVLKGMTKADIIGEGLRLNVPYQYTWSCYEGGDAPCGKCASCIDRINAFKSNGAIDPTYKED